MLPLGELIDRLRRSFWLFPGAAIVAGLVLGYAMPRLDDALDIQSFLVELEDADYARGLLETIATATVSVAGITFSVTVVALQLASQQLGPRVLRTFQADRLAQVTLAVFLGAFVYCLALLATLGSGAGSLPTVSLTLAILMAAVAFGLFVAFIHDIVVSLQASTLIRRIATDGHRAVDERFPTGIGGEPGDPSAAAEQAARRRAGGPGTPVGAPRAGYLRVVQGEALIEAARRYDALVVQRAPVGEFVVTGGLLAELWARGDAEAAAAAVAGAFELGDERTVVQDVAFPVRQLADVALRALSPSLNDPTTADNAMGSLADTLIRYAGCEPPPAVRVDEEGEPRLVAAVPSIDDLVRLGFEQVGTAADGMPATQARLVELLEEVRRAAQARGAGTTEIDRQIERLRGAGEAGAATGSS